MIIYLAGPIRATKITTVEENVSAAKAAALDLWQQGYTVICPHANSDLPISVAEKSLDARTWLDGDLEILARCDALVILPNSETSIGVRGEYRFACQNKIPIYHYPLLKPIVLQCPFCGNIPEPFLEDDIYLVRCTDSFCQAYDMEPMSIRSWNTRVK